LSPVPPSESADVFLDLLGGPYTELGVSVLKRHGRLVVLGGLAGTAAALDERALMLKQLTIIGSVLRARPLHEKIAAFQSFRNWIKPLLERGKIQPNVDKVFRLDEIKARLGQPDGISRSRMAEMLEVDKAGPKVRC
jgi:NADPH:quinone reductase